MLPPFTYIRPRAVEDVGPLLEKHAGRARVLAGGTDLLVRMRSGFDRPDVLIDIKALPVLRRLALDGALSIGAAVRVNELLESAEAAGRFPLLAQAALRMASHQIRNRATVVGNLCNASPAGDMAVALLALDAEVRIRGVRGERRVSLDCFFTGPKQCALAPGEWVVSAEVPVLPEGARTSFLKQARIRGPDLATVNCAGVRRADGTTTLALGAVAGRPVKISGLEEDPESLSDRVRDAISPIDDVRGSAEYRRDLACVLARRVLEDLGGRAPGG